MTRRRTSVIGPGKAAAHQPPPPTPGPDTSEARLWHWGLMATRELSLSLLGEEGQEAQQLQAVRRRWRIAQGRESGNPAPSSGRSVVNRIAEASGQAFWRKHFDGDQLHWQLNELAVLTYLGTQDRQSQHGLREQVAWMRQVKTHEGSSSLQTVETLDAGPSLDDWREFAPCALVQGLPLPLFAQADFLAALTRQALIGLERLARHHVVHNDIKPSNLCLALGLPPKAHEHCFSTVLDLQRLPLRFIDFELAFAPSAPRLVQAHQNVWVSPYARACHAAAAEDQLHPEDRLARLAGIDWGADLWSLGFMVAEWVKAAQSYLGAWLDAVRQTWGDGSNTYHLADRVVGQQSRALGALSRFAKTLQAQDRPVSDAGSNRLPARTSLPLASLRADLESSYPVLTRGAKHSQRQLTLIDPEAPLDLPLPVRGLGTRAMAAALWPIMPARYRRTAVHGLALVGRGGAYGQQRKSAQSVHSNREQCHVPSGRKLAK
ncbi:MAG: hypothetical protein U5L74_03325 [Ideonella sp.]|nr:hypothetical protein [Ideonella sp.]